MSFKVEAGGGNDRSLFYVSTTGTWTNICCINSGPPPRRVDSGVRREFAELEVLNGRGSSTLWPCFKSRSRGRLVLTNKYQRSCLAMLFKNLHVLSRDHELHHFSGRLREYTGLTRLKTNNLLLNYAKPLQDAGLVSNGREH